ncbi:MAG: site-2 protease family protein [Aeromicrobium erythreum]
MGGRGRPGDGILDAVLWSLGWVNLLVALFNLVPGLPLDGGRVLRAVVWGVTGDEALGVRVAAWVGRLTAVAVVAWVLLFRDRLGPSWYVDLALAVIVGAVLWSGATDALRQADRLARVNRLHLDRLTAPLDPAVPVPAGLPTLPMGLHGTGLLRAMAAHPATTYLVVDPQGRATGLLHADAVDDAYRRKP